MKTSSQFFNVHCYHMLYATYRNLGLSVDAAHNATRERRLIMDRKMTLKLKSKSKA